jgi:hypothetical protein
MRYARAALPWIALGLAFGYAAFVHHGLGPRPDGALAWWAPRGFLSGQAVARSLGTAMLALWPPAWGLALLCFLTTRSSLARTAAVTAALATGIFIFYGLGSQITRFAWKFFGWRASATMVALAAAMAAELVSPWLAARWLKLPAWARLVWYLPLFLAVVAIERNVTGTDPLLRFSISPWPVVQVFGLETLGTVLAAQAAGISIGLLGLARIRRRPGALGVAAGAAVVALGLAVPPLWLVLGSQGLLPFRASAGLLAAATATCAVLLALAATVRVRLRPHGLRYRGLTFGTGALLMAAPLLVGEAWARWDYGETREVRAARAIEGLGRYFEREGVYPDDLETLVLAGDLMSVPRPRIGFAALGGERSFTYQAFGDSYLLEFAAPRWVQCAYNPPYADEDDDEGGSGEAEDDLGKGAWSCPSTPPQLW